MSFVTLGFVRDAQCYCVFDAVCFRFIQLLREEKMDFSPIFLGLVVAFMLGSKDVLLLSLCSYS